MLHTQPDFDRALLNFRLFLKLGTPSWLGPRGKLPLQPPSLSGPGNEHYTPKLIADHSSCLLSRSAIEFYYLSTVVTLYRNCNTKEEVKRCWVASG